MNAVRLIPVGLALVLLGAHLLRAGSPGGAAAALLAVGLLALKRRWVALVFQVGLVGAAAVWVDTLVRIAQARAQLDAPWGRMAVILGLVAALTAASSLLFRLGSLRARYADGAQTARASLAAFLVTAGLLGIVQVKVSLPMLLPGRFLPGGGWLAVLLLATYAAWITEQMLAPKQQPAWRRRVWGLFSLVFFAQLAFGLAGLERFLLTGELHLPVPALIVAGPLYRGEGLFMPILFGATVLLVGPAWCSHLCYIGAWDSAMATTKRRPGPLPAWAPAVRIVILVAIIAAALVLRALGAQPVTAAVVAVAFGLVGVGVMAAASRRTGTMAHCVVYCPVGLVANLLGRLSPWRLRLGTGCDACGACAKVCRYDALSDADIERRRPGLTCTLCGDCVGACKASAMQYRFPGLSAGAARTLFIVMVVSLHAVFLGVARM